MVENGCKTARVSDRTVRQILILQMAAHLTCPLVTDA